MTGYTVRGKEGVVKQAVTCERDAVLDRPDVMVIVVPTPRAALRAATGWWWDGWTRVTSAPGDPTR